MAIAVTLVVPQVAEAHPVTHSRQVRVHGEFGFCVEAAATQEHAWHSITTSSTNCNNFRNSWHTHNLEYYKVPMAGGAGTFCFDNGWYQSAHANSAVYMNVFRWDIGNWCNYGGIHHWITTDTWQYSWKNDWEGYKGGAVRPHTWHCHCP
jgi:hypothetical protein